MNERDEAIDEMLGKKPGKRPHDSPFNLRLSQKDLRIIAAYLGVLELTDDDVNRYAIAAVRSCLDQDECYLRAKTERGRIRARIKKGLTR